MTPLTHPAMRLALGVLASLALMIGVVVIGQETARAGLQVGAAPHNINAHDVGETHSLVVESCEATPSHAAHHCHCLVRPSSMVRPGTGGLRRPKETPVLPWVLWTSCHSTACARHGIALYAPGNECAFPGGRDLLVRTARLLI